MKPYRRCVQPQILILWILFYSSNVWLIPVIYFGVFILKRIEVLLTFYIFVP